MTNRKPERAKVCVLRVEINGEVWNEVARLQEAGPNDRVYSVRIEPDRSVITFGDGQNGRRLPSDRSTIAASYRIGQGAVTSVITSTWTNAGKQVQVPLSTRILHSKDEMSIEASPAARGCLDALLRWLRLRVN